MSVHAMKRNIDTEDKLDMAFVDRLYTKDELPLLLSNTDYVANLLPSTTETRGMLNGEMLAHCTRPGGRPSVFINAGRGDIIDEEEILHALDSSYVEHVILDVFVEEPLPTHSRLWSHPQCTITSHTAALTSPKAMSRVFAENLRKWRNDEPLLYEIDWDLGY